MDLYPDGNDYSAASAPVWTYNGLHQLPSSSPFVAQQVMDVYQSQSPHQDPHQHQHQLHHQHQQHQLQLQQHQHFSDWEGRPAVPSQKASESKPRLAKEEVERLEAEFQNNPKPNSNLKKGLAERMGVNVARINNWFQNRRAKAKQERRTAQFEAERRQEKELAAAAEPELKEFFSDSNHCDRLRSCSAPLHAQDAGSAKPTDGQSDLADKRCQSSSLPARPEVIVPSTEHEMAAAATAATPSPPSSCCYSTPESPFSPDQSHLHYGGVSGLFNDLSMLQMPMPMFNTDMFDSISPVDSDLSYQQLPPASPAARSPASPGTQDGPFPSPPGLTIASRRNAPRPTPLGLDSLRRPSCPSQSSLRTNKSFSSSIRRVSSSSAGSGRIQKATISSASPLSPYLDRNGDALLRMAQSPQTPHTPLLSSHLPVHEAPSPDHDGGFVVAYQSARLGAHHFSMDANLTTPPTTPGLGTDLAGPLFGISAGGYNQSLHPHCELPLGSAFEAGSAHSSMRPSSGPVGVGAVPNYIGGSQPVTPSFSPQASLHMGGAASVGLGPVMSAYGPQHQHQHQHEHLCGGGNGGADYSWVDAAVPILLTRSSPGLLKSNQFSAHFTFGDSC